MNIKFIIDQIKTISHKGKYHFFSSFIEKLTSLFFFITIAKLFSVEEYGQIVTVFTVSNIVLIFFHFGLPTYLQREAAIGENYSTTFSSIVLIKIFLSIPYYLIVFIYFYVDSTKLNIWFILIISFTAFILDIINILNHHFFGKDKFVNTFYAVIISRFTLIILLAIFWFLEVSLFYFVIVYLLTALVRLAVLIIDLIREQFPFSFRKKNLFIEKNILKISFPLGLAYLFNFVYDRIDILMISNYIGDSAVAQYNVAYSFYKLSGLFFAMILVPSFNQLSKETRDLPIVNKNFIIIGKTIASFSVLFVFAYYFLGSSIIDMIFSDKYNQAENILPTLSFAILGMGLNSFTGVYLNSRAHFKMVMYSAFFGVVTNIIFNIIFLPKIGIIAAVYSTIITEYMIFIIQCCFIFKLYRLNK